jgi:hypothetical protein
LRHWLLTGLHLAGLHLSRIIVLLLRMDLFSRNAEHKPAHCATLVMPHVPEVWLRSDCGFMVMLVRLMSLHRQ